jgi:hypothetical protein
MKSFENEITSETSDHHNIAVSEIDHIEDTVDQGISNGDQGINTAKGNTSQC